MKRFFKHIGLRIIITYILLVCLDLVFTYTLTKNSIIRNKIDYISNTQNNHFNSIFLGSSRVEYHVNTDLIDSITTTKSLNLGISGQSLSETFLTFKLLVANNIKAEKYFIQIDEKGLSEKKYKSFIGASSFMPYSKNEYVKEHLKKHDPDYYKDYYIPFYRYLNYGYKIGYREIVLKLSGKKRVEKFYIGLSETIQNKNASYYFNNDYEINLLNEIISFSKEKKLNIIFYTSPYYNPRNTVKFKGFCIKNNIVSYVDSISSKDKFKDPEHLNHKGANEFTKQLIRDFY
tara:strand:- start:8623 stop:9489 length:867 start_codon:yes stop_codon:yes gene_type:complete